MVILVFENRESNIEKAVRLAAPEALIHAFHREEELLAFAEDHLFSTVFFQLGDKGKERLEFAEQRLLHIIPGINLIIVADNGKYLREAVRLHASGYIDEGITEEKVRRELENLLYPAAVRPRISIVRNGNTRAYLDGEPIRFKYSKTNELLSILLENNGRMCSTSWLVEYLWEDRDRKINTRSYFQNLRVDLKRTLAEYEMDNIIISRRGEMGINMKALEPEEV